MKRKEMAKLNFGKGALRCALALVLCFMMLASSLPAVNARAEGEKVGNGGDRTITVVVPAAYRGAAAGAKLALYQVGECINGDFLLYESCGVDEINEDNKDDIVKTYLDPWCEKNPGKLMQEIEITEGNSDFSCTFTNLKVAPYLVRLVGDHPTVNMKSALISLLNSETKELEPKFEAAVQVFVEKVWNDDGDAQGIRPESITVKLVRIENGQETAYPDEQSALATLNEGNKWQASRSNLPTGNGVSYAWREDDVPGYIASYSKKDSNHFVVTNTLDTTSTSVTKAWEDNDNAAGVRPTDGVHVQLVVDGKEVADVDTYVAGEDGTLVRQPVSGLRTLVPTSEDGNEWSTETISNLPIYKADGSKYQYTWKELNSGDYKPQYSTDEKTQTITVTNHYPNVKLMTIKKVWEDGDNQDGIRPDSLHVTLTQSVTRDGKTETKVYWEGDLKEESSWEATVINLPETDGNDNEYTYWWDEEDVNKKIDLKGLDAGYTRDPAGPNKEGDGEETTFTNTHTPETVELTIEKKWYKWDVDDQGNPKQVEIDVSDVDSIMIELKATEDDSTFVTLENKEGATTLTKGLFKGAVVTGTGKWSWTISNLPKRNKSANDINYLITEVSSDKVGVYAEGKDYYYFKSTKPNTVADPVTGAYTISNYSLERTKVTVYKQWIDAVDGVANADGTRPESITITLAREDGQGTPASRTITTADGWICEFPNLLKYTEDGKLINYVVSEVVPEPYEMEVGPTSRDENGNIYVTITNTYTPPYGRLTIDKSVTINGESVDTSDDNKGTFTFEISGPNDFSDTKTISTSERGIGSVTYQKLTPGEYTITEVGLDENVAVVGANPVKVEVQPLVDPATPTITRAPAVASFVNNKTVVEPTPAPTASVEGSKVWEDNGNERGVRPATIELKLSRQTEGEGEVWHEVNVAPSWGATDGDTWSYSFKDLPDLDEEGKKYTYKVEETPVQYYTSSVDPETGAIVNTIDERVPEEYTDITGAKIWNDGGNAAGSRPPYISVTLQRRLETEGEQGEWETVGSATVTAATNWQYRFDQVPLDDGYGHRYAYRINEVTVYGYYTVMNGYNVTNGIIPDEPPTPPDNPPTPPYNPPTPPDNPPTPPDVPPEEPPRYRTPPEFEEMTEEQLEELVDLFDYETPLFGRPLGTGDEIPVYPFVFAGIGLVAVLVLVLGRKRGKNGV